MGCKGKQQNKSEPARRVLEINELTLVKYLGFVDKDDYIGEVTGRSYEFGLLVRTTGYIDSRDVDGFKKIEEDGQLVFKDE